MTLFRSEPLARRRAPAVGAIAVRRPRALTALVGLAVAAVVALGGLLSVGEYTRKARVAGHLAPRTGVVRIHAPEPATVVARHVDDGQAVAAGDPLLTLSVDRPGTGGPIHRAIAGQLAAQQRSLVAQRRRLGVFEAAERRAVGRRMSALARELAGLEREVGFLAAMTENAEAAGRRFEALAQAGFVSALYASQRRDDVLDRKSRLAALERSRAGLEGQLLALDAERDLLSARFADRRDALDREIAALDERLLANDARREIVLRAPRDGVVSAVGAHAGQLVVPGTSLLAVVPVGVPLEARLFASARSIGFVRAGQHVMLRYAAFPFQKFGQYPGIVASVSEAAIGAGSDGLSAAVAGAGSEPLYQITVAIAEPFVVAYGRREALRPDMHVEGDVFVDRRRLIEWILEPLIAAARRT